MKLSRREVVFGTAALAAAPTAVAAPQRNIKLGFDNFAVRAFGYKAPRLIELAGELKVDSLFITDLDAFQAFDDLYLKDVRKRADDAGIQIHLGTWSICPTSGTFKNKWGTADEHLQLGIKMAKALGSPVLRVILGNVDDRKTPGGIKARIADTVKVLKKNRSRARDAGVKIAMENHAGDMQSHEVVSLVEAAGKDFVGINIDPGNAVWAMEDPIANLETMAPYVVTSSMRDSIIWESDKGATVQWTAMGGGIVDFPRYFEIFAARCPGVPVHIETISGFNRELPYLDEGHFALYPDMKASALARFVALAKKGRKADPWKAAPGKERALAEQEFQRSELEKSLAYCRQTLGLGVRTS